VKPVKYSPPIKEKILKLLFKSALKVNLLEKIIKE
jgi:hypothetical protein